MRREINYKGIEAYIGNYTPRRNEYEKGLKYTLFINGVPSGHFSKITEARAYLFNNYYVWL